MLRDDGGKGDYVLYEQVNSMLFHEVSRNIFPLIERYHWVFRQLFQIDITYHHRFDDRIAISRKQLLTSNFALQLETNIAVGQMVIIFFKAKCVASAARYLLNLKKVK